MDKIIHLSLTRKNVPTRIDVVQYATKPNIVFVLDDFTPTGTASLYIEKPDGTKIYNACTIDGNQVTYTPTTQSFAALGTNKCQLQIVESDGTAVSFLIYADVTENIIDSSAVESQDEFTALEEALQTVSDYDGRISSLETNLDRLDHYAVKIVSATSSGELQAKDSSNGMRLRTTTARANSNRMVEFNDDSIVFTNLNSSTELWKQRMPQGALTLTRIENSYVNAAKFAELKAYDMGEFLWFNGVVGLSTQMPTGSGSVDIAQISNWSAKEVIYADVSVQNGSGTLAITVSKTGKVSISNASGSTITTSNGWAMMPLIVPKA